MADRIHICIHRCTCCTASQLRCSRLVRNAPRPYLPSPTPELLIIVTRARWTRLKTHRPVQKLLHPPNGTTIIRGSTSANISEKMPSRICGPCCHSHTAASTVPRLCAWVVCMGDMHRTSPPLHDALTIMTHYSLTRLGSTCARLPLANGGQDRSRDVTQDLANYPPTAAQGSWRLLQTCGPASRCHDPQPCMQRSVPCFGSMHA